MRIDSHRATCIENCFVGGHLTAKWPRRRRAYLVSESIEVNRQTSKYFHRRTMPCGPEQNVPSVRRWGQMRSFNARSFAALRLMIGRSKPVLKKSPSDIRPEIRKKRIERVGSVKPSGIGSEGDRSFPNCNSCGYATPISPHPLVFDHQDRGNAVIDRRAFTSFITSSVEL